MVSKYPSMPVIITEDITPDNITLTENEYNLVLYCLENHFSEFNKEEYEDAFSIINKLNQIKEVK
tara:strand:+ start:1006 stop:1200 length:195 start_codon:yes stop_codon:yes gene_type:complete